MTRRERDRAVWPPPSRTAVGRSPSGGSAGITGGWSSMTSGGCSTGLFGGGTGLSGGSLGGLRCGVVRSGVGCLTSAFVVAVVPPVLLVSASEYQHRYHDDGSLEPSSPKQAFSAATLPARAQQNNLIREGGVCFFLPLDYFSLWEKVSALCCRVCPTLDWCQLLRSGAHPGHVGQWNLFLPACLRAEKSCYSRANVFGSRSARKERFQDASTFGTPALVYGYVPTLRDHEWTGRNGLPNSTH